MQAAKRHCHLRCRGESTESTRRCNAVGDFQHFPPDSWPDPVLGSSAANSIFGDGMGYREVREMFCMREEADRSLRNEYLNSKAGRAENGEE